MPDASPPDAPPPDPSAAKPCPICGRPAAPNPRLAPFCSPRCADVDLGRWFTGAYSVPTVEADEDSTDLDAEA